MRPLDFSVTDVGRAFEMQMRLCVAARASRVPVVSEELLPRFVLDGIHVTGGLNLVGAGVASRFDNAVLLRNAEADKARRARSSDSYRFAAVQRQDIHHGEVVLALTVNTRCREASECLL